MSDATIEVTGLRKRFGAALALDGMTFNVIPGRVTGFIGPNGAGKSTTIRVILGLDAPDEGRALVCGQPYQDLRHPLSHVGALVDAARVLADASVDELIARASGDQILLRTNAPAEAASALRRAGSAATVIDGNTLSVSGLEAQHVVEVLGQARVPFSEVIAQRATLEDVYLQLTSGEAEFRAGSDTEAQR